MNEHSQGRSLTFVEAIIPIASLVLLVATSYYLFGDAGAFGPNQVALVVATMIAVLVAWRRGFSLDELHEAAVASVNSGLSAIFILLAVGALIGTWALSGTLVAMVYYGLQILQPELLLHDDGRDLRHHLGQHRQLLDDSGDDWRRPHGRFQQHGIEPGDHRCGRHLRLLFRRHDLAAVQLGESAAGASGAKLYDHIRETALVSTLALAIAIGVFWTLGSPGEFDASAKIAI